MATTRSDFVAFTRVTTLQMPKPRAPTTTAFLFAMLPMSSGW
jgi:hypothetical protein